MTKTRYAFCMILLFGWGACGPASTQPTDSTPSSGAGPVLSDASILSLAQSSIDQFQLKDRSQNLENIVNYIPEGVRGYVPDNAVRGYAPSQGVRGRVGESRSAIQPPAVACARYNRYETACCKPDDPCARSGDGVCDCRGIFDWDLADCPVGPTPDPCCNADDSCGLGGNGYCDCDKLFIWDAIDCQNVEVEIYEFGALYEPDCRLEGSVYSGETQFRRSIRNQPGFALDLESIEFSGYVENGASYEGRIVSESEYEIEDQCFERGSGIEYFSFKGPDGGLVDGEFEVEEISCNRGMGEETTLVYAFDDFIFDCVKPTPDACSFINLNYAQTLTPGKKLIEQRVAGALDGKPLVSFFNYTETELANGEVQVEGFGVNYANETGQEIGLDYLFTLAQDQCALPKTGFMNLNVGAETRNVAFDCSNLAAGQ